MTAKRLYFCFVFIPFIICTVYLLFFASNRYRSEVGFAIRSMEADGNSDLISSFTGLTGSNVSANSDSYIVVKFLESRDLLEAIKGRVDFQDIYGNEGIDLISKLLPNLNIEKQLSHWKRFIKSSFDPSSGIIQIEVEAFDPNEAQILASVVLDEVKILVNELSEQARKDAMSYTEEELDLAEERLINARTNLKQFRENTNSFDLTASAIAQVELLANLEQQLIEIRSRIDVLNESLENDAPSIKALSRKAEALEIQIFRKSGGLNITGYEGELSDLLSKQEKLEAEKSFAENVYSSALTSLESARIQASRNQRYLAVYNYPSIPENKVYPHKLLHPIIVFLFLNLAWGIFYLIYYAVKDHLTSGWIED